MRRAFERNGLDERRTTKNILLVPAFDLQLSCMGRQRLTAQIAAQTNCEREKERGRERKGEIREGGERESAVSSRARGEQR